MKYTSTSCESHRFCSLKKELHRVEIHVTKSHLIIGKGCLNNCTERDARFTFLPETMIADFKAADCGHQHTHPCAAHHKNILCRKKPNLMKMFQNKIEL